MSAQQRVEGDPSLAHVVIILAAAAGLTALLGFAFAIAISAVRSGALG